MPTKLRTGVVRSGAVQVSGDRRREERHFVSLGKPVYISWVHEESLLGKLIEMSRSGFRMVHQYRRFEIGQEVRVSFPWGKVRAIVVWNRATRKQVETGFSIPEGSGREMRCSGEGPTDIHTR
jgi:hypothetical protein